MSPTSAARMPMSDGRTRPTIAVTASTSRGVRMPRKVTAISVTAQIA